MNMRLFVSPLLLFVVFLICITAAYGQDDAENDDSSTSPPKPSLTYPGPRTPASEGSGQLRP